MPLFWNPPKPVTLREAQTLDEPGFRALGTHERDLPRATLHKAQDLSVALYRRNPVANRAIRIYQSWIAGEGFGIEYDSPDVEAVVTEFWDSERNHLNRHHRSYVGDWLRFGEAVHPVSVDSSGNVTFGFIDPKTIDAVHRNPRSMMLLDAVTIRSDFGQPETLTVIQRDTDLESPTLGFLKGDTFLWLHDRIAAGRQGTPWLLPALDWLDAYDQVLWTMLERAKILRAHFYDVEVDGDADDIRDVQELWGTTAPTPGSVRFRTPRTKVSIEAPQIGQHEDAVGARFQLRHLATGLGVSPHMLSDPEDANRSTAEQMDIPVLRSISDVQEEWRLNMTDAIRFAIDAKIQARLLPATVTDHDGNRIPAIEAFQVVTPEVDTQNSERAAAALASTATAVTQLVGNQIIGTETARLVVRAMFPALGIDVDSLPDDDEDLPGFVAAVATESDTPDPFMERLQRLAVDMS